MRLDGRADAGPVVVCQHAVGYSPAFRTCRRLADNLGGNDYSDTRPVRTLRGHRSPTVTASRSHPDHLEGNTVVTSALPLRATQDYPLLNLFWTMFFLFIWIIWFFLLFRIIVDIFRSDDLGGFAKALWIIFIIVLPYLGVLVYLIARGSGMQARDARQARANNEQMRSYIQSAAGTPSSTAEELSKLAALRDQGVLTSDEFEAQKSRLLA